MSTNDVQMELFPPVGSSTDVNYYTPSSAVGSSLPSTTTVPEASTVSTYSFFGNNIRVIPDSRGNVLFVGRDICQALGYINPNKAMSDHCKGITLRYTLNTVGGPQSYRMLTEGDMYRLIFNSRLPDAARFESWVVNTVLPSIRSSGAFITPDKAREIINNPDVLIELCLRVKAAESKVDELEGKLQHSAVQIGILEPKAAIADTFLNSRGNMRIRDFAKIVKSQLGLRSFGQKAMFEWLRNNGYLITGNFPSQRASDADLFYVVQGTHFNPVTQHHDNHHTTKITPKGQVFFMNKLRKEFGAHADNV